jgi:glutaredoxin 3
MTEESKENELNKLREKKKEELTQETNKPKKEVIVYSSPHCAYCVMLKEFLKQKKISFIEKNVSSNLLAGIELERKTGRQAVPAIDIDGKIIIGFNKTAIENALKE